MNYYEEELTTEEQDIVNEAVEKFHEVLINRRKEEWEAYWDNKKYYEKAIAELRVKREAFEKEKRAFETSRDALYKQFKKDWFDELGFQFKVRDKVWYAHGEYERKECPVCRGKKTFEVQTPYGDEITCKCPKCEGRGYNSVVQNTPKSGVVKEIRATVVRNEKSCYVGSESIFSYNDKCEVWLTSDNTGENKCFKPSSLYHTKEECEAAIEQAKEKEKKCG